MLKLKPSFLSKGFRLLAALVLFFCLIPLDAIAQSSQSFHSSGGEGWFWYKEQQEVPHIVLKPHTASNTYKMRGYINDKPVIFVVDTGASGVAFSAETAQYLSTPPCYGNFSANTANGIVHGCKTIVADLMFGPFVLSNVPAGVVPKMERGRVLLGMAVLQNFDISINNGRMRIAQNKNGRVNPNYRPKINWFAPQSEIEGDFLYRVNKFAGLVFIVILLGLAVGFFIKTVQLLRK